MAGMPPTADVVFLQGLDFFTDVVRRVAPDQWTRPSPCAGWRAVDVLGHVGSAVRFGATLLREGEGSWKPVDPPGQAVDGDPLQWWEQIAGGAREVVTEADLTKVVDAPRGPRTVADGLSFPAVDLFVHAWDLGRSAGVEVVVPDDAMAFAHAVLDGVPAGQMRSPAVFADEVAAPPGASPTEAFVAWTGRDPRWSAS